MSVLSADDPGLCCPEISFKNSSVPFSGFSAQCAALTKEQRDKLEKAMAAREKKYGYKRGSNANLTKPSKYADVPDNQFADIVGFNYPITQKYIRGALSYWNQPKNRKAYKDPKAREFITQRIIKAALKFDITVTYNPKDPEYVKLPDGLKKQLKNYDASSYLLSLNFNALRGQVNPSEFIPNLDVFQERA
jgi:hypothetical protein